MNQTVNIAKGIAIISMVIGHVISSENFISIFIYKWHMPLFFFFSGYFFNAEKYSVQQFLYKKIKTIYFPFVFWSLLILYLHNILIDVHINPLPYYDLQKFKILTYRIIFELRQYEALLGTFWFLIQLLIVNILACIIFQITTNKLSPKYFYYSKICILIISLICCIIFNKYHLLFYYHFGWISLLSFSFFVSGYILKSYDLSKKWILIFSIIVLTFSGQSFKEMIALNYNEILPYSITALCGIILVYNISSIIKNIQLIGKLLSFIGQQSYSIMILHFASFKIVSYLIVKYNNLPSDNIAEHPVIHNVSTTWQIFYIIMGISLPIFLNKLYQITKFKLSII